MRHDLLGPGCHRGRAILPGQCNLLLNAVEVKARLQLGHLIGYTIVARVLLQIGMVTHLLIRLRGGFLFIVITFGHLLVFLRDAGH